MIRAANLTQVTDYYKSNTVSKQNNTEKAKDVQPNAQKINPAKISYLLRHRNIWKHCVRIMRISILLLLIKAMISED